MGWKYWQGLYQGRGSVLPKVVKVGYTELNLMYYFTAGEKEVGRVSSMSWNPVSRFGAGPS